MRTNYDYRWSYDFSHHLAFIRWMATTFALPGLDLTREAYHPPLYYLIAGTAMRLGVRESRLGTISIVCGALRLLVLRKVFNRWLGRSSLGAQVALLVAALQPTSIHLDGMATGEGLSNLEAAVAMWLVPSLFWRDRAAGSRGRLAGRPSWRAAALGIVLGLALLTKISVLSILAALAVGVALECFWAWRAAAREAGSLRRGGPRPGGLRGVLAAWLVVGALAASISGWYFARNLKLYGKPFLSGFDGPDKYLMNAVRGTPFFERRPVEYFHCWTSDIYRFPYYPSGVQPRSCFWPQLVASSWVDFYRYGFSNGQGPGALRTPILQAARASVAGGTVLGVCAAATTLWLLGWAWRRQDAALLSLMLMPVIALGGQLYFATAFPIDGQGMVKGLYLQFASPPLYAAIGLAVSWLWRSRLGRPIALALLACIALVGSYSIACRFLPAPGAQPGGGIG